jgi:hypothetical protein
VSGYVAAFALTLLVEPPLYAGALRLLGDRWWRGYGAALLGNATSHPLTWLVLYPLLERRVPASAAFVVVEAFAVAWEAALLRRLLRHDRLVLAGLSLLANAVSLGLGAAVLR